MKLFTIFIIIVLGIFIIDQNIKYIFVDGYSYIGECINLELHYNKGVAFSMLSFLDSSLKWIQSALILLIIYFLFNNGYIQKYYFPSGLLIGSALSNIYDRFIHEGVVDYVAWHCGFNFAIFNFADIVINISIIWILIIYHSNKEINV